MLFLVLCLCMEYKSTRKGFSSWFNNLIASLRLQRHKINTLLCKGVSGSPRPSYTSSLCLLSPEEWWKCYPAVQIKIIKNMRDVKCTVMEIWEISKRIWLEDGRWPRKMAPKPELKLHQRYFGMNNIQTCQKYKRFSLGTYLLFQWKEVFSLYGLLITVKLKAQHKDTNMIRWELWARNADFHLLKRSFSMMCLKNDKESECGLSTPDPLGSSWETKANGLKSERFKLLNV